MAKVVGIDLGTTNSCIAVQEGDSDKGCFLCGQVAATVNKVQPAAEIIREVMEEAEPVLKSACRWITEEEA